MNDYPNVDGATRLAGTLVILFGFAMLAATVGVLVAML